MIEPQQPKKKLKYKINSIQRKALIGRIYPILLVGSLVWLSGEYLFYFLFSGLEFTELNLVYYIIIVIVEVILFILFFFTSKSNKVLLSILIYNPLLSFRNYKFTYSDLYRIYTPSSYVCQSVSWCKPYS